MQISIRTRHGCRFLTWSLLVAVTLTLFVSAKESKGEIRLLSSVNRRIKLSSPSATHLFYNSVMPSRLPL